MRSIGSLLLATTSRAPWPVWRDSTRSDVRFQPITRKTVAKLFHKARRWDRDTRRPGKHGGIIGRTALSVLYTLAFDFLNHQTGRLDPSLDAIAYKAGCCRRSVVTALAKLRNLGLITWLRRCEGTHDADGRYRLRQKTNAYGLLPSSQWLGAPPDSPLPEPGTWGDAISVPMVDPELAVALRGYERLASIHWDANDTKKHSP